MPKRALYVYVGAQNGFNGGGLITSTQTFGANGGGGTDIRLIKHNESTWGGTTSLRTRIIVAGGGGGACNRGDNYGDGNGGYGGGLTGGTGQSINNSGRNAYYICTGGSQTTGGTSNGAGTYTGTSGSVGAFGYAQQADITYSGLIQAAAGGGWYGGGAFGHSGGGGGSSFISGMAGCNGINNQTGAHRGAGQPSIIDGVTYTFTSPVMHAGNSASRPANPGGVLGYAKISSQ